MHHLVLNPHTGHQHVAVDAPSSTWPSDWHQLSSVAPGKKAWLERWFEVCHPACRRHDTSLCQPEYVFFSIAVPSDAAFVYSQLQKLTATWLTACPHASPSSGRCQHVHHTRHRSVHSAANSSTSTGGLLCINQLRELNWTDSFNISVCNKTGVRRKFKSTDTSTWSETPMLSTETPVARFQLSMLRKKGIIIVIHKSISDWSSCMKCITHSAWLESSRVHPSLRDEHQTGKNWGQRHLCNARPTGLSWHCSCGWFRWKGPKQVYGETQRAEL